MFRAHTFRANHGTRLHGAKRVLALVLLAAAAACHAQSQQQDKQPDSYRTIPDWVKIDRASLIDASYAAGPEEKLPTLSAQQPTPWPEKESWLRQRYVRMVAADAYKIAANSAPGSYQHDPPAPRNDIYRPAVSQNQANAWRVTVPNLRRNVAKVMLHRSF